jgi:hypothetical protein
MHPVRIGLVATAFAGSPGATPNRFQSPPAPLVVHEWGTITTMHAASGRPEGCLNRISGSDALPDFVHRFEPAGLTVPAGNPAFTPIPDTKRLPLVKAALAECRPDVTMRLETPVIYFHPAASAASIPPFDVNVRFRGGVLNEFYPDANASATDAAERSFDGASLRNSVIGELHWRGLSLADSIAVRQTAAHVWLAPRTAQAAGVRTRAGETERYLFYRGVAHLDAVIRTERSGASVRILGPMNTEWIRNSSVEIRDAWLFDVRPNGAAAFRRVGALNVSKSSSSAALATVPLFNDDAYCATSISDLRTAMHRALVAAGLNSDEAAAMLETWSNSYFHTPGLRLFYLVPREWADHFVPLDVSVPSAITRVMVGRVDLEP